MGSVDSTRANDVTAVFRQESQGVFGYLLLRCGSRSVAEDLTADTFVNAIALFNSGRGNEVTAAWLRTVAKRRLIDYWRSSGSRRRRIEELARQPREESAPDLDPDGRIDLALSAIPDRQRAVLVLRYLEGFSTSEVADIVGSSYKATESLLARARKSFAVAFEETR